MALTLPGVSSGQQAKYIKSINVTFKASTGKYNYYRDGEDFTLDTFEWVVVGSGFEFQGTVGRPSKKKSISLQSDTFGWDHFKNGTIRITQFLRDWEERSHSKYGEKTYTEWKEEGLRLHRVVFVLKDQEIYKIVFSPIPAYTIGKTLQANQDIPNYNAIFTISKDKDGNAVMFENDNGEFFQPALIKASPIQQSEEAFILENIKFIDNIINQKEELKINEPEQPKTPRQAPSNTLDIADLPF